LNRESQPPQRSPATVPAHMRLGAKAARKLAVKPPPCKHFLAIVAQPYRANVRLRLPLSNRNAERPQVGVDHWSKSPSSHVQRRWLDGVRRQLADRQLKALKHTHFPTGRGRLRIPAAIGMHRLD